MHSIGISLADVPGSNHNMDPAVVGSAQFGQLFKTQLPGNYGGVAEQVFASPLVYTTSDGVQYVYIATQQNNIYKINAKTGAIVASRNLHIPFLTADLDGCVDINPHVGSTATGVIDPNTNTWYLTTKTYANQNVVGAQGRPNGRYYVHAISVDDLSERSNFPVDLEGTVARNNPARSFNGGIHHQRPALLHQGQYIYAGFASHCVQYNFTGWIMGWDKDTGKTVEMYATEGAGVKNTVPGAGVWMSGGGLASDNAGSMFFASGNGYASQLNGIPVAGRQPPTSLEEAAVHMTINSDGTLTPVDFFMPWEKTQLDGADKDLGTSPLEILPSQFSCGNVKRIGVVTGKSGKTYWLNLDDMGGYQNGANKLDNVLQVYQNENSVYAGAGVYPLEGGYIYINVIQYPTHVFKFSCDSGVPSFTKVADSPEKNAYILGVGHGTTTSLNDQAGTGLVWTQDVEGANLRIYNAVPQNGQLTLINSFNIPGTTKFSRPVFGDGRAYMITTTGYFYGFGSPVNLPLNCSSPYDFGTVNLNNTSAYKTIQCQASVDTQVTGLSISGNKNFVIGNYSTLPVTVSKGKTFSFQAAFAPGQVGSLSSDVLINTTQGATTGYTTSTPVRLKGTGQSVNAILGVTPNTVSFDGVITGQQVGGVSQSVILLNQGNANLTITEIQCSDSSETGPFTIKQITNASVVCGPFTFTKIPTTIAGNSQATVNIAFDPTTSGSYATFLNVKSTGGTKVIDVLGVAGTYPSALLEFQTPDGTGWVTYDNTTAFSFGDVLENTSRNLKMRLTNQGTNSSTSLSVTVSKPPFGVSGIIGAQNQVDLAEGTILGPGESATATLYCSVPKSQINVDSYSGSAQWTMNLGDPLFGKQHIQFACNAVSEQSLPQFANGTSKYRYQGCYKENNPGRQLKTQIYGSSSNTNEMCVKACSDAGYTYAGTEYLTECWCSSYPPTLQVDDANCNYACAGNINEICGGNGIDAAGSYISLFMDTTQGAGSVPKGPFTNNGTNGYSSIGCYTEGTNGRALSVGKGLGQATNVANCTAACAGYTYAGVEYGQECYCGNTFGVGSVAAPLTDCNMVCAGNSSEYCGAGNRLNVYALNSATTSTSSGASASASISVSTSTSATSSASATPTGPVQPLTVGSYKFVDCHTEATNARALTGKTVASDDMTLDNCAAACSGFLYFGVEYARECYCGNALSAGSVTTLDGRCSMPCKGNALQYCGGSNGLSLYMFSNTTTTSTSASASTSASSSVSSAISSSTATTSNITSVPPSSSTSIVASSVASSNTSSIFASSSASIVVSSSSSATSASSASSSSASWSSSSSASSSTSSSSAAPSSSSALPSSSVIASSSAAASSVASSSSAVQSSVSSWMPSSSTSIASSSSSSSNFASSSAPSTISSAVASSSVAPSSSASKSASSTSSIVPSASVSATPWQYLGCANETNPRALSLAATASNTMTIQQCQSYCLSKNYPLAGLEYGRECYCGTALQSYSTLGFTGCNMPCAGSASDTCGGSSRLSVYNYTSYVAPQLIATVGTYQLQGCYSEPSNGRALSAYSFSNSTGMTAEWCVSGCQLKGYAYAGMEYGQECWCANTLSTSSTKLADSACNMLCPGNQREYCGAGSKLALYKAN
ncbi:hypothetical protein L486_05749 [Kwoniella mangroviensis CBS 10435]|uniref:WSC domain-containing protein n=1 Tax=Kwoniella mangroviensis CBS 10435 TaxID=1331196 RepID=A0A1B9INF5_9TREE|nr:hypothetical protein L486_05749 [Kwoniella mangroviensis CBS 10435]